VESSIAETCKKECHWSYEELATQVDLDKKLVIGHVKHGKGMQPETLKNMPGPSRTSGGVVFLLNAPNSEAVRPIYHLSAPVLIRTLSYESSFSAREYANQRPT
jgi:hypothetical protein